MNQSPDAEISLHNSASIAPPAGHYSHVCIAGGVAYISGMLPVTNKGQPLTGEGFEKQAQMVLKNLQGCLEQVGLSTNDLVQVRVYVTDIANWPVFNRIYAKWIGEHRPARAVAGVSQLHFNLEVEVEAIAIVPVGS